MTGSAIFALVLGVPLAAALPIDFYIVPGTWPPSAATISALMLMCAIGVLCVLAIRRKWNAGARLSAAALSTFALLWVPTCGMSTRDIRLKMMCGATGLQSYATLRWLGQTVYDSVSKGTPRPPSLLTFGLGLDHQPVHSLWSSWANESCTRLRLGSIRVGRYSLEDLARGRVSLQEFEDEVHLVSPDPAGWENIGVGAICLTPEAWTSAGPPRITGYMFVGGIAEECFLLWSDVAVLGSTETWQGRGGRNDVIDTAQRARQEGWPGVPRELLDFMHISEADIEAR
jgi:hypothetical protein